jgi:hypothetical protein
VEGTEDTIDVVLLVSADEIARQIPGCSIYCNSVSNCAIAQCQNINSVAIVVLGYVVTVRNLVVDVVNI